MATFKELKLALRAKVLEVARWVLRMFGYELFQVEDVQSIQEHLLYLERVAFSSGHFNTVSGRQPVAVRKMQRSAQRARQLTHCRYMSAQELVEKRAYGV